MDSEKNTYGKCLSRDVQGSRPILDLSHASFLAKDAASERTFSRPTEAEKTQNLGKRV